MNTKFLADYRRYKRREWSFRNIKDIMTSRVLRYIWTGRKAEESPHFRRFWMLIHKNIGRKMGCEINDFANIREGIFLSHPYAITVSDGSILGENVTLFKGSTIGNIRSGKRAGNPIVEDNVTVCCNAMVCGNITIGHDSLISANAFVDFDVPPHSVVIGNPGKVYHKENASKDYL